MARHTKGSNIIGLVKMVKAGRKTGQVTEVPPEVDEFLSARILLSDWYPMEMFLALLEIAHREIAGATEDGALKLGAMGAHLAHEGVHRAFIKTGDAARTMLALAGIWQRLFDFGELEAELIGDDGVRYVLTGYPDISELHGQVLLGWIRETISIAGAEHDESIIEKRPWRGDPRYQVIARWRSA